MEVPNVAKALAFDRVRRSVHERGSRQSNASIFATGLNNPRGLTFGPDGTLFVAEGGAGGNQSTVGICEQVPAPVGPYTGGMTARISRITPDGVRHTVLDQLPSSQTSADSGGLISGVADVKFIDDELFAILAGAAALTDCWARAMRSSGSKRTTRGRKSPTSAPTRRFIQWPIPIQKISSPMARGSAWSPPTMPCLPSNRTTRNSTRSRATVELRGSPISRSRFVRMSGTAGPGPTAITRDGDDFYIGNLHTFPIVDGSSMILRVTASGKVETVVTGLTTVLGLAFDWRHRLYVLENTTGNPFPTPGTGRCSVSVVMEPSKRSRRDCFSRQR